MEKVYMGFKFSLVKLQIRELFLYVSHLNYISSLIQPKFNHIHSFKESKLTILDEIKYFKYFLLNSLYLTNKIYEKPMKKYALKVILNLCIFNNEDL